jgi:hypothetical protein
VGLHLSCPLAVGAAIALTGCVLRGGIDLKPATLTLGTSSDASKAGESRSASSGGHQISAGSKSIAARDDQSTSTNKHHVITSGAQPTNDIEKIAWKSGIKAVNAELDRQEERCGFATPVEIQYAVPMKEWIGAEGWGLWRGCTDSTQHGGGCMNLSVCGAVVEMLWFDLCGNIGEGVKTRFKGWNTKVKKLVCRGEGVPPEASAIDHEYTKMKAVLANDGTLTVTLHPSDANVSWDFGNYLEPRVEAD